MTRYYLDTCVWRDHFENRVSLSERPIGNYATGLIMKIIKNKDIILVSDINIKELNKDYNLEEIRMMFNLLFLLGNLKRITINKDQYYESKKIGTSRKVPIDDAFHAVLARDHDSILVTRDRHFDMLDDIVKIVKPEQI